MEVFTELNSTGKKFEFMQGVDERLLNEEKVKVIFESNHVNEFRFAFDDVKDYATIEQKLKIIRSFTDKIVKFYVLCGYKSTDEQDIEEIFIRISLLMRHKCIPYIMRYEGESGAPWKKSKYRGIYITVARWCNQPSLFKKKSFREFCDLEKSSKRYLQMFENENERSKEISKEYFDMKWGQV